MTYYYEVSVSKSGAGPSAVNPFNRGDRTHWVRKGVPRATFVEAQADAIVNGERPYRIKREGAQPPEKAVARG